MIDLTVINDAILDTFTDRLPVTLIGPGEPPVEIEAIYDSRYYTMEMGEMGGATLITSIVVKTAVADTIEIGETAIFARAIEYRAKTKRPESEGMVAVELEKAC